MDVRPLADLYRVAERFRRSVNVAADLRDAEALAGYVPTAMVRALVRRMVSELARKDGHRAWSITGPYGAGKSAFALFVSRVLGYPVDAAARRLLEEVDGRLYRELCAAASLAHGGFVVVPVVGSREPLVRSLVAGLRWAAEGLPAGSRRLEAVREGLITLDEGVRRGEAVVADEVAQAVVGLAEAATAEAPGRIAGVLVVYDELGRALEYAAMRPEAADVGLLQTLAEAAARSAEAPVVLVTILHQAFQNYAARLGVAQQREWAKVQGRFVDVPFLQSTGEVLTLVGHAIQRGEGDGQLAEAAEAAAQRAADLGLLPPGFDEEELRGALARCAPLHPTVALVLERLVRSSLAQNERSLFAFLASREPHGLQEHLEAARWGANGRLPFYRLDQLYDYARDALGSRLYGGAQARRWALVEEALDRLPAEAGALDARVLKTVGMLELLGDGRRVKASPEVVAFALGDAGGEAAVRAALERLAAARVVVFRRFKGAYGLWEGSDVDLEGRLAEGLAQVAPTARLAEVVERAWRPVPRVAKRHLHETGTFRFFRTWVVDAEALAEVKERPLKGADGAMVMVAPGAREGLGSLYKAVSQLMDRLPDDRRQGLIFAIPRDVQGVWEAALEVLACQWVERNTPQLAGDAVARRELAERELAARERLTRIMQHCLGLASDAEAVWLYDGQELAIRSAHDLSAAVSAACDRMYEQAPIVKNELVNRRSLSSAAAAGRRNLIEAMLKHPHEERLGLEGYPPEVSMYLSVLAASGLHRERDGVWSFGPPPADDPCRVRPLWDAIDDFLAHTQDRPLPVEELYERLAAPPLGVLPGLMPIYLTAALLHWWDTMAVFEQGTFVPEPGIAHLERLLRVPERFTLQRYTPTPGRQEVLWGYARVFQQDPDPRQVTVLGCTRMLLTLAAGLPPYTLRTDALSAEARAVREALLTARQPQTLLFQALPVGLGYLDIEWSDERREAYLLALRQALIELRDAYANLLERIRRGLYEALHVSADHPQAREALASAAEACIPLSSDLRLEAFLRRLADQQLGDREWLESVGAVVVHKSPREWLDRDIVTLESGLAELSAQFRRLQDIALARGVRVGGGRVMRLGLTDSEGRELSQIVHGSPEEEAGVAKIVRELNAVLDSSTLQPQARLLAVAELARQLLDNTDQKVTDA